MSGTDKEIKTIFSQDPVGDPADEGPGWTMQNRAQDSAFRKLGRSYLSIRRSIPVLGGCTRATRTRINCVFRCGFMAGSPTFFLLLRRGATSGLVASLLNYGDGGDDASLAAQPPLLLLLLQVLEDVLGPLVRTRHGPRREGFLGKCERGREWKQKVKRKQQQTVCRRSDVKEQKRSNKFQDSFGNICAQII